MERTWQGFYLDGRSAARHPVTIQIMRNGLHVTTSLNKKFAWSYPTIRQTQGSYKGEQIRLETGTELPEALIVQDHNFLVALKKAAPDLTTHFHDPRKRSHRVKLTVYAALGTIVLTVCLYMWGIPGFAGFVTPFVPVSWEDRLGKLVVERLAPVEQRCTDPKIIEPLNQLVTQLADAAPDNPYKIKLFVVKHPLVNAFAAPGGYVVVFSGLLELTDRPEQLAGVLAHEFQHVYKRHTTRAIIQHTSSSVLLAAVAGDFSGAMTYGIEAARTMGMMRYSRNHEQEADREGLQLLVDAGMDPQGMVEFFSLLQKKYPDLPNMMKYISSHPNTQTRIDDLEQMIQPLSPSPSPLLPEVDWKEVRKVCKMQRRESSAPKSDRP